MAGFEPILSPLRVAGDSAEPDEIHLLRFEAAEGLDAVRRDPEMAALGPLRREIGRKALLVRVADVPLERYFRKRPAAAGRPPSRRRRSPPTRSSRVPKGIVVKGQLPM